MTPDIMEKALLNQQYYPKSYRREDVQQIAEHLAKFQPLTIIGLPRIGLARTLRFLLVHPELLEKKLKSKKIFLLEIDINDLFFQNETSFWQLTLKRILDEAEKRKVNHNIKNLYLSAVQANDAFTFFDNTKQAVTQLFAYGYYVFLFFNRFDRAFPLFTYLFFAHLQSLKDVAKTKINYLFTSNRPLEYLSPDVFKGGNLEVFSPKYFLKPSSKVDLLPIINEFEKTRKIKVNNKIKKVVYYYSGGHAQYALLVLQALEKSNYNLKNIDFLLKNDLSILEQGRELWDFLTTEEKGLIISNKNLPPEHFLVQIGLINNDVFLNPLFCRFSKSQKLLEKSTDTELTKKEKALLTLLLNNEGNISLREDIINFVWPEKPEEVNEWTLDQLVKRLRKKLVVLKDNYLIVTVKNQGYKLINKV